MRAEQSDPNRRRGFNIIELVVAIGVAGLLSTMALPRFLPAMNLMRYRSAMQQVVMELRGDLDFAEDPV